MDTPRSPRCEEEAIAAFDGHHGHNNIRRSNDEKKEALLRHANPWNSSARNLASPKLKVGDIAPNSKIVTLVEDEKKKKTVEQQQVTMKYKATSNLHSILQKDSRPTVLVFGSITCPSFRSLFLKEIVDVISEQKGAVRLVVVYLAEAYPKDGEFAHMARHHRSKSNGGGGGGDATKPEEGDSLAATVPTHMTIEDRIAAAQLLLKLYDPQHIEELVVDTMDDDTDKQYHAQPSRVYVIENEKIVYLSEQGPYRISPSSLQAFLWERQQQSNTSQRATVIEEPEE